MKTCDWCNGRKYVYLIKHGRIKCPNCKETKVVHINEKSQILTTLLNKKSLIADFKQKILETDYSQTETVIVIRLIGDQKPVKMFVDSYNLSKEED